jgi:hypothetical protein
MNLVRHLPPLGALVAVGILIAAAARYPGGTDKSPDTVGFRCGENFLCALFQPVALNGAENPARPLAIVGLLLLCASMGVVFFRISRSTTLRLHRSAIEIGGIGTAVYAVFVPTVLHNVAVNVGLLFSLCAYAAIGAVLWVERRRGLFACGVALLALKTATAVSYYGDVRYDLLPSMQVAGVVGGLGWILAVYYRGRA